MSAVLPFPAPTARDLAPSAEIVPIKGAGLSGHRERLRERARSAGLHHLPDYELLELFLFRSQPQGDVKPNRPSRALAIGLTTPCGWLRTRNSTSSS